ncbi:MAG: protein of unknown function (DUF3179) [Haloquadratum sp. J07HQX50]|nr:MAG: protein of unknown function (DUF3179) [Haloquadratum sp. J07HQX50]
MQRPTRRHFLVLGATLLAGCAGSQTSADDTTAEPASISSPTSSESSSQSTPAGSGRIEAVIPQASKPLPLPSTPEAIRNEARSGGPPKDGIPSIDDPHFITPAEVDFLAPGDPVFGVQHNGVTKAYPQNILVQHEIVNDTLGDVPATVTYCPLTGTAMGFRRGSTTFGVSGRLVNNNLIMYDRATETWWPQMLATGIPGPWEENPPTTSLSEFRVIWTTWDRWQQQHPDTAVLSTQTGHARNYNNDPYGSYNSREGYYTTDAAPLFEELNSDDRFPPKKVVMGVRTPAGAAAFVKDTIRSTGIVRGSIGDDSIIAVYDPRYDTAHAYANPDNRQFKYEGTEIIGIDGTAYSPDALPLNSLYIFDAMWFAWAGFYPETAVYE